MNQLSSHRPIQYFHLLGYSLLAGLLSGLTIFIIFFCGGSLIVFSPYATIDTADTMGWANVVVMIYGIPASIVLSVIITFVVGLILRIRNASTNFSLRLIITGIIIGSIISIGFLVFMAINIFNRTPGF